MLVIEERQEMCMVATKLVSVRLYRQKELDAPGEGEIVDFHCSSRGANCEHKCSYKMLLLDF